MNFKYDLIKYIYHELIYHVDDNLIISILELLQYGTGDIFILVHFSIKILVYIKIGSPPLDITFG